MVPWSSNENIYRVTGHLCGEFTGPSEFPPQRPVTQSLMISLICAWINGWVNSREAGDLKRNRGHHDVTVMSPAGYKTNTGSFSQNIRVLKAPEIYDYAIGVLM